MLDGVILYTIILFFGSSCDRSVGLSRMAFCVLKDPDLSEIPRMTTRSHG